MKNELIKAHNLLCEGDEENVALEEKGMLVEDVERILREEAIDPKAPSEGDAQLNTRELLKIFKPFFKGVAEAYKGKFVGIARNGKDKFLDIVMAGNVLRYDFKTQMVKYNAPLFK